MMKNLLVTGGMGFIGSNFILYMLEKYRSVNIINLDLLTYAADPDYLREAKSSPNYRFVHGDIADPFLVEQLFNEGIDAVVHFAAETHVDRSIQESFPFVHTNVVGTQNLLETARRYHIKKFVHISTDEVYGSLGPTGFFSEQSPLLPSSPYSASKASSDLLALAYFRTHQLPVVVTRCSNNYGPHQNEEKLIPLIIQRVMRNEPIPIYGNGKNVRDWLYVIDHCRAIELVLYNGRPGEIYNIGANNERTNVEIALRILAEFGKPPSFLHFVEDRPGHDFRYAIDAEKIRKKLNWIPVYNFETGLRETLQWYVQHFSKQMKPQQIDNRQKLSNHQHESSTDKSAGESS